MLTTRHKVFWHSSGQWCNFKFSAPQQKTIGRPPPLAKFSAKLSAVLLHFKHHVPENAQLFYFTVVFTNID